MQTIAIIGGGASGLMAACSALRANRQARVIIIERNSRMGKKLLATGNGRCNMTNMHADIGKYHTDYAAEAESVLSQFKPERAMEFFGELGLAYHITTDGLVYPRSMQAASVLDALRFEADKLGAQVICDFDAVKMTKDGGVYVVHDKSGKTITADKVIVAAGSHASTNGAEQQLLKPFGHTYSKSHPALVPLATDVSAIKTAAGMRAMAQATLMIDGKSVRSEYGEVQFCDYGLSGIVIMQLSGIVSEHFAYSKKGAVEIALDLMNEYSAESCRDMLFSRRAALGHVDTENFLCGVLNKRVAMAVIKAAGCDFSRTAAEISDAQIIRITEILKDWRIAVTGTRGYAQAQVCGGGLRISEFDGHTLESKLVCGMYAVGEALDIYGDCGGYNLHWAWASGWVAGTAAGMDAGQ